MNGLAGSHRILSEASNGYPNIMEELDMRKRLVWICAGALALCVGAGSVLAAGQGQSNPRGKNYVDADGDGVCDRYDGSSTPAGTGKNYVDADGDGVCDRYDSGCTPAGTGKNYVDADNNGVCDHYESGYAQHGGGHHGRQGGRNA